jgi:O-antigen/teichoic acid export membrane protein
MKSRLGFYNLIIGLGSQLIILALGIVIPRLFLVNFGSEVNGLMASIGQVFIYLALLEAGVGAASLQALYKPISKKDRDNINSILAATSIYYKKTGVYYFIAVIILSIIYPLVISSSLSKLTVMSVIFLTGLGGVINFFVKSKYIILLTAEGKNYINTTIVTVISILTSIVKIILLIQGFNIIIIQASYFLITILQVIIVHMYIKRSYKWINLNVTPNFKAIGQKNSVLVHEASTLVFRNTDIILLTLFCNLKVVSVYVLYNMLFSIIDSVVHTVHSSVTFALGQTYHENRENFIKLYDSFETYFMAFVFSLFTVAYILIIPFMKLYTEGINDINYIDFWLPILFVSLKLLSLARTPSSTAIDIAGHFKETKNRSILETIINLVCSLLLVNIFGMYGVLLGTIIALLYRSADMIFYTSKNILYRKSWITIRRWLLNTGLFLILIIISELLNIDPSSYIDIFLWAVFLSVIVIPVYLITCSLFERDVFDYSKSYFKNIIRKVTYKGIRPKLFAK